ncbi:MAG TPA: hypothetical protein VLD67_19895 [Vicinamibacterales bacterium]|nr:hypothetical protein [Vicinamibacterales bacterium]
MKDRSARVRCWLPIVAVAASLGLAAPPVAGQSDKKAKPSVNLRASPSMGFAPLRVVFTAELKGGQNDYEEFYCATVEWEIQVLAGMGGGGKAEQQLECEPYEPGKSEIKRRYVREHTFKLGGEYRIQFRLKQKDKIVGGGGMTIKIREGVGDPGGTR